MGRVKGASAPFLLRRSGRLCISQSISGGAGGSPLRPLAGVGALAGAPPRPRNSILRRPRRQRRGAPARRLAGVGGLRLAAAALIQWGGRCRRRSSVVGGAPLSCVCRAPCVCGGGGVAVARGAAGPFTSMHSKPPRAPRPRRCPCAPAGAGLEFRWLRPAGTARPLSRAGVYRLSFYGLIISHLPARFHINIANRHLIRKGNDHAQHLSQSQHTGVLLV